ncbi:MAG: elongation factor G [bacterium]
MDVENSKLRNIGIIAHIDAGKTTTTERILYYTGRIWKMGEVHDGTTTMDWMSEERSRGITIQSAVTTCFWDCPKNEKHQINIIDTPGHVDFTAEVERSLRVLDGGVVIFCGVGGVEPQSETVWRQATKYNIPMVAFVNKLDRVGSDFWKVIREMRENFTQRIIPIAVPVGKEKDFKGIIDVVTGRVRIYTNESDGTEWREDDVPESMKDVWQKAYGELLECLSENDDEILEKIVSNKPVPENLVKKALRFAVLNKKFVPVVCGSAFKNKGVQLLLDAVCLYLPSPVDVAAAPIFNSETLEKFDLKDLPSENFRAIVFKIVTDQFLGKLSYLRVYSGRSSPGRVYNTTRDKVEKIDRIFSVHADKKKVIDIMTAGDIVAVAGLKRTKTGETLSSEKDKFVFEPTIFPEPVICQAVEAQSPAQIDILANALSKLKDEDPTFIVKKDSVTNETVIYGMGELHLEINVNRLRKEFNVPVKVSRPRVRYKEGITKEIIEEGKFVKQTGGHGQYAHVILKVTPSPATNYEFVNSIKGGSIPVQFISPIEKGVKLALDSGPLAGYPVRNIKVELLDGSFHEVDSSDIAFRIGAFETMKSALKKAAPVLLEPIMSIEINVPTQFLGDILGDISSRRGTPAGLTSENNLTTIKAFAPLAEMFGYATTLRSLTQGRASYVMEPKSYERVPKPVADKVIGKL